MIKYIFSMSDASLRLLKADTEQEKREVFHLYNALDDLNIETYKDLFDGIMSGRYAVASHKRKLHWRIITKSLRGDWVQVSHFAKINGEWEPTSHGDVREPEEFWEYLPSGYFNIQMQR